MSNPATPSQEATPGQTPAAPAPAAAPASSSKVEIDESELAQLKRDAARAADAQSKADRLERQYQRRKTVSEPEPFTDKEKAEIVSGVSQLILSKPEYGKLVQDNPALRKVLLGKNPLSILDTTDFVDIQDAVSQLEDFLVDEVARVGGNGSAPAPSAPAATPSPVPLNPQASATPVKTDVEKKQEELAKIPGMGGVEARLASRIGVKV